MITENVFLFGFKGVMRLTMLMCHVLIIQLINQKKSKKTYIIYILIITVIVVQNNFFK